MAFALEPCLGSTPDRIAQLLNESFEDYIVPVHFDSLLVAYLLRAEGLDLASSRILLRHGEPAGIALIMRRGTESRLGGFGIAKTQRGKGAGRWFMEQLIEEARGRGERRMFLEVIEQNEAAVHLYEGLGFRQMRRLVGYSLESPAGEPGDLQEVDMRDVAHQIIRHGAADLPWQIKGETLAFYSLPGRAFRLGDAWVALSPPHHASVVLKALIVPRESRRRGEATRLLKALFDRFPNKTWKVAPTWPAEESPEFFESLGFRREPISQFQMDLPLV